MKKRTMKIAISILAAGVLIYGIYTGVNAMLFVPTPASPDPNKRVVACIGDSITFGAGVLYSRNADSYPAILQTMVGDEFQIINFGHSGRTLQDEGDNPYREEKVYTQSLNCDAEIYIVMLGTNDSKPYNWNSLRYETELADFLQTYIDLPQKPKVYVMLQPNAFPDPKRKDGLAVYDIDGNVIETEIIPIVSRIAEQKGIETIDLHTLTENHPEWMTDGVHPNKTGNAEIAQEIYCVIEPSLN